MSIFKCSLNIVLFKNKKKTIPIGNILQGYSL